MVAQAKSLMARFLAFSLVLAALLGFGLMGVHRHAKPVQAQQSLPLPATRALAVAGLFAAEGRGDADAAVAEFAANGIFAASSATDPCPPATPCSGAAGIRAQLENNISIHGCHTIVELNVAGAVITGRTETRTDTRRANGVERGIQSFLALVPQDKITYLVIVNDVADAQTALNAAITAGTQPAGTPIPAPTTPCSAS